MLGIGKALKFEKHTNTHLLLTPRQMESLPSKTRIQYYID